MSDLKPVQTIDNLARNLADHLRSSLQPADIGLAIDLTIGYVVEDIRSGCDHGCSGAFLALLKQGINDLIAEDKELVDPANISPELQAIIDGVQG